MGRDGASGGILGDSGWEWEWVGDWGGHFRYDARCVGLRYEDHKHGISTWGFGKEGTSS